MTELIRTGTRSRFDSIVIDSPANRNALSLRLLTEALNAVRDSARGAGRGLVIEHAGPAFCSGVDLKERRALAREDQSHSRLLADLLRELWRYPKPVVVFVDGAVRGGGLGVLSCADLVVATTASTFAYSEARVGVAPALVMAVTLATASSRELMPHLLTGAAFDAATAESLGLVGRVVDTAERFDVDGVLGSFTHGAPAAQAVIKQLSRDWVTRDVSAVLHQMTVLSAELFAGDEAREGMTAFAEHRPPHWHDDRPMPSETNTP
ncbi:enoyl-CoA hydratase-related protein [Actinophytocola sp.]|uniref:enoyl-CoA hydratase-related protein n=1 Tax=Actinophytocola sp. TaxID=1872138 RepID=UPI003D6A34E7